MRKKAIVKLAMALAVAAVLAPCLVQAQDLHPSRRPSPMGMARITLDDGTYVRVVYSRPYKRGRDNIFGTQESEALVPFGQVWRTGANEATEITVTGDVLFGGETLKAGTYSLFTTPGAESWQIHVNTVLGTSGTRDYKSENDAVSVTVPSGSPEEEVDQLTISFEKTEAGADMVLAWIKTTVRVPIQPAS